MMFSTKARFKGAAFLGCLVAASLAVMPAIGAEPAAQKSDEAKFMEGIDPRTRLNPVAMSRVFLDNERPDLACALLLQVFGPEPERADVLGMLGECKAAAGEVSAAIDYTEKAYRIEPNSTALRAQLGGLYIRTGRVEEARQVFSASAGAGLSSSGDQLLAEIARQLPSADPLLAVPEGGKPWSVELYSGLVYDSNANGGPASSTVAAVVGGVPLTLTLSDASKPKNAWGNVSSVNASYIEPLSAQWALLFQGGLAATTYFDEDDFSTDSGAVSAALIYRTPTLTVSVQPNARYVQQNHHLDETLVGVTSRATLSLDPVWSVTGSAGYARRNVAVDEQRDADLWLATAGFSHVLANGGQLGAEYLLQRNKAREDFNAYWQHGPLVYYTQSLMPGLIGTASYRFGISDYDERLAIFAETREDKQHVLGAGLEWDISQWTAPGLSARAQYSYIDTSSTVDLYEYDRHIVNTGLAFRF